MPVEFDCRGCGIHVFAAVPDTVPEPPLCAVCSNCPGWQADPYLARIFGEPPAETA